MHSAAFKSFRTASSETALCYAIARTNDMQSSNIQQISVGDTGWSKNTFF